MAVLVLQSSASVREVHGKRTNDAESRLTISPFVSLYQGEEEEEFEFQTPTGCSDDK